MSNRQLLTQLAVEVIRDNYEDQFGDHGNLGATRWVAARIRRLYFLDPQSARKSLACLHLDLENSTSQNISLTQEQQVKLKLLWEPDTHVLYAGMGAGVDLDVVAAKEGVFNDRRPEDGSAHPGDD